MRKIRDTVGFYREVREGREETSEMSQIQHASLNTILDEKNVPIDKKSQSQPG
jgi:hypothetical protein